MLEFSLVLLMVGMFGRSTFNIDSLLFCFWTRALPMLICVP